MVLGAPLIGFCLLSSFFIKDVVLEGRSSEVPEGTEAGVENAEKGDPAVDPHNV